MQGAGVAGFGPIGWGDAGNLVVGHGWLAREDVPQGGEGVDLLSATGFNDGVEDCGAFSGLERFQKTSSFSYRWQWV